MAVDLHTHSTASDGSDSPEALVAAAAALGLEAIALTDHDTLAGIPAAKRAAADAGIEFVPGAEISCDWEPGSMHLVVLFLEPVPGPLQDRLHHLQAARDARNERIVERLHGLGIDISLAEVREEAGEGSVGRPHFAAVLVRKGAVESIPAAFDELLAKGRPAYVERERLTPEEAISLARASEAVPVLAHPHTLGLTSAAEFAAAFERLAAAGLMGIESSYGEYDQPQRDELTATARRFGLVPSGGSDYHGAYKEGTDLGTGRGDLAVPYAVLDELRQARRNLVGRR